MKYREIGPQKQESSAIVLGCMRMDTLYPKQVEEIVETALDVGINTFDHADIYGQGRSESIFGKVLTAKPGLRRKIFLQSKCGIRDGFFDFSKEHIMASAEAILSRLQTDHLDMLLLHRPDTLMEPEEVSEAFTKLNRDGKVLNFGVSNMNPMQIELLSKYLPFPLAANQLQFSAAHTPVIDAGLNVNMAAEPGIMRDGSVLEYCRLKNIMIQTWSSLQYGYFEGTFLGNEQFSDLNQCLELIAKKLDITSAAAAIAWILRHPAGMQAIIGTTRPDRIRQLAKASDVTLTREEWYKIYRSAGNILP